MNTHITAGLGLIVLTSLCVAGEIVKQQDVTIPFSEPGGNLATPANVAFRLPAGDYKITLRVTRGDWDKNVESAAQHVPIGLGAYCVTPDKREVNKQPWKTANGEVSVKITVGAGRVLHVVFSTIAPLGAKGVLIIEDVSPRAANAAHAAAPVRRRPAGMR